MATAAACISRNLRPATDLSVVADCEIVWVEVTITLVVVIVTTLEVVVVPLSMVMVDSVVVVVIICVEDVTVGVIVRDVVTDLSSSTTCLGCD